MKDTFFSENHMINCGGKLIDLSTPKVMGIINATPDSFYSKSRTETHTEILKKVEQFHREGVDFIDIGGYSSRPGADDIPIEEEIKRTAPIIYEIVKKFPNTSISIDTFRASVAKEAIDAGAQIINDISGGDLDSEMHNLVRSKQVPYILMHMRGTPQTMKNLNKYNNITSEVIKELSNKVSALKEKGVKDIIIDPGFGFAKNIEQNFELLKNFKLLKQFDCPILIGVSRKSMIYKTLNINPSEALNGSTVLNTFSILNGANIIRVHDVKEAKETIELCKHLK